MVNEDENIEEQDMQNKIEIEEQNIKDDSKIIDKNDLSLQGFFNDMNSLQKQLEDPNLIKPTYNFGDASVTNYLLWLLLGELMILNNNLEDD